MIMLDSLVPREIHGALGAAQLAWLRLALDAPAPDGSIVVFDGQPVVSVGPEADARIAAACQAGPSQAPRPPSTRAVMPHTTRPSIG
jgi:hypothetical protein